MGALAIVTCQKADGNLPIHKIVSEYGVKDVFMLGDYSYNDGAVQTINGVTALIAKYGDGNNTVAKCVERYTYAYGRAGRPQYQQFWSYCDVAANGVSVWAMEDDHDFAWNNNDFKLATFKGAFNVAGGTSTTDALALTDVLVQWRIAVAAKRLVRAAYFRNQVSTSGNGDTPNQMVGVGDVTTNDFPITYFINDYACDYAGNLTLLQHVVGAAVPIAPGTALRVIVPDCKSYTDHAARTDDSSKTMLGLTQEAWLRASIIYGQSATAKVTIGWTKDWFNRDNGDGGVGFQTYRETLFTWIHTNGYAVDHITGDRHQPHVGIARTNLGAAYDATTVCVCPSGQGTGSLVQYAENIMSYPANDACIIGTVELDMALGIKYLTMRDANSWEPLVQVPLRFGERVPTLPVISAKQFHYTNNPASNVLSPTAPASTVAYSNPYNTWLAVLVQATMTAVSLSFDGGANFVLVSTAAAMTGGYWLLPPGGQIKITYSAITVFSVVPLPY